ncbi:MAG: PilN domain-containing protein [Planctomycetales bacterium]|nr:PilN domain-containing protein [Planctomycetales bacterium]
MKTHVNLLSPQFANKQQALRTIKIWGVISACGLISLVLWSAWQYQTLQHRTAQLEILSKRQQRAKETTAEFTRLVNERDKLLERERSVLEVADVPLILPLLGIVSNAAKRTNGALHVDTLHFERSSASNRRGSPPPKPAAKGGVLKLSGTAKDNLAIAQFAATIRDAAIFQSVYLDEAGSVNRSQKSRSKGLKFTISCSLLPDLLPPAAVSNQEEA